MLCFPDNLAKVNLSGGATFFGTSLVSPAGFRSDGSPFFGCRDWDVEKEKILVGSKSHIMYGNENWARLGAEIPKNICTIDKRLRLWYLAIHLFWKTNDKLNYFVAAVLVNKNIHPQFPKIARCSSHCHPHQPQPPTDCPVGESKLWRLGVDFFARAFRARRRVHFPACCYDVSPTWWVAGENDSEVLLWKPKQEEKHCTDNYRLEMYRN